MQAVRIISANLQGRVAMSRAVSGLVWKVVVRSLLPSAELLAHRVAAKVSAHRRAARRMGRRTGAAAQRAGWGIALADGSSRSSSAVRVEVRDSAALAALRPALSSAVALAPSRSEITTAASTMAWVLSISRGRSLNLSPMTCTAATVARDLRRMTAVHALRRLLSAVSVPQRDRRRCSISRAAKVIGVIAACEAGTW